MIGNKYKTISSEVVYRNKWYQVREDEVIMPDGREGTFAVVEKPPVVYVVPVNEKKEICLINLFRYTTQKQSWEVIAGGSENQDLRTAAQRELQEETGYTAAKLVEVGSNVYANGISSALCYMFVAEELSLTKHNEQVEEGIDDVQWFSYTNVLEMIKSGEINSSHSIAAITLAALYLDLS